MAGKKRLPLKETQAYKRRQMGLLKRKARHQRMRAKRAVAAQAAKVAVQNLAEEAFGPGGLTPQRQQALSAVVLGPEAGVATINNPHTLRRFINKARKKFHENADRYIDVHLRATQAALTDSQYDVAARHAEWAMEHLGDETERVVTTAPKVVAAGAVGPQNLILGVSLGGRPPKEE